MTTVTRLYFGLPLLLLTLSACSIDVMPVHESRVKSAHLAERPLERGRDAPGAFHFVWRFEKPDGYTFDPSRIEFKGGAAHLKNPPLRLKSVIETSSGIRFSALDEFVETPGAGHAGKIRYQLSTNATAWFYFNGNVWTPGGPSSDQASTIEELNAGAHRFHAEVGFGSLYVRIFLAPKIGTEAASIRQLEAYGVNTARDGWD